MLHKVSTNNVLWSRKKKRNERNGLQNVAKIVHREDPRFSRGLRS
jgi:hypothetical protein